MTQETSYHLRVFQDRSVLLVAEDREETFAEGPASAEAQTRQRKVAARLDAGFLTRRVEIACRGETAADADLLTDDARNQINRIVEAVTSEVGRAIVGLTVLQLCIKCIAPEQSIRLHKSGRKQSDFSWREGISMRGLDKRYITTTLRQYGLLKLNADGFMMTRSLAENYPYSRVYKAAIRGNRLAWLEIVESLESGSLDPSAALDYLLSRLVAAGEKFKELSERALRATEEAKNGSRFRRIGDALALINRHIFESSNPPRLMEVALHSFFQALIALGYLESYELKPLSQMRSANKKHGNIGDVELLQDGEIAQAWDAKFGKTYLRDELEELDDKLNERTQVVQAGFVLSSPADFRPEIRARIEELEEKWSIRLSVRTLSEWIQDRLAEAGVEANEECVANEWVRAYVESLTLKRPDEAPIDEPTTAWVESFLSCIETQ